MSNQVPQNELKDRRRQLQVALNDANKDGIILPLGVNFSYLFGKQGVPSERLIAGVLPVNGDPFIISPAFERTNIANSTGINDIVIWEETENPYTILAKDFDDRGIGFNLAVDPKLWTVETERIVKASGRNLTSAGSLLHGLRVTKSDWEIDQLQKASKYSTNGILEAFNHLNSGMTEKEFAKIVSNEMENFSGNPASFAAVQFADNSAIPHGRPTDKKLKNDNVVLVDAGTSVNGYQGDITITIPHGSPDGFKEIYEIVFDANRRAFDNHQEGISGAELDNLARAYIDSQGYGRFFTHRLGHGIGLEVHEEPYLVATNETPFVAGNTHTIEPGIYQEGKFGIRIEDDVVLTKNGAKLLFKTPRHNF